MPRTRKGQFDYDVCLSFAGDDRRYVAAVAAALKRQGIRVFYDEYEEVALWGKDLYEHLHVVYSQLARYCVVFISKRYAEKLWTTHERRSAQERAFKEHSEYILPARFDGTRLPGLRDTIGYIDLTSRAPEVFAKLIVAKIGNRQRHDYFPPVPDRLLKELPLDGEKDPETIVERARDFYSALRRTSERERKVIFAIMLHGCPAELPDNIHINLDLLRRLTGITPPALKRIVGGLSSLGFSSQLRQEHGHGNKLVKQELIQLQFDSRSVDHGGEATETAVTLVRLATEGHCSECAMKALMVLDFGQIAEATHVRDAHRKNPKRSPRST